MAWEKAGILAEGIGLEKMKILFSILRLAAMIGICYIAYNVRMHAVNTFGKVIHEFDPYFNFRAAEYLVDNGWHKFINWFDERTWYPLGRPIGTTIYPGLQITAAVLHKLMNEFGYPISINDVCVMIPAWFSSITCFATFGMAYEVTKSANAGVVAAFVMSILPAHIMRSVAGGFDNESIAMGALCLTFFLWMRSLRTKKSWPIGILTGLSYIYMVAAWGGYVFVLNMIGVHAIFLVCIGMYSNNLHRAYSLFYVIGTLGAIQFPVVGLAPLKSLEQLGPMGVFFILQLAAVMDYRKRTVTETPRSFQAFQFKLIAGCVAVGVGVIAYLAPRGYFGPLSSRIRGLFVQHTHTGNPLVDSVAEHQATQDDAYFQFFHAMCYFAPVGFLSMLWNRSEAKFFLFLYALIGLYFSRKMNRLVLLLGPAVSVLGGLAVCGLAEWSLYQFYCLYAFMTKSSAPVEESAPDAKEDKAADGVKKDKKKDKDKKKEKTAEKEKSSSVTDTAEAAVSSFKPFVEMKEVGTKYYNKLVPVRVLVGCGLLFVIATRLLGFWAHSNQMAVMLSNPSIILQGTRQDGTVVMLDDFREAYWWLRDHTPLDARVLSWWDYGYQISQISNRTTLADGNTWNHEHIALLGKILVSPVKESHKIARHLADYVLVWSTRFVGNPGDDIAKSPHMARIGGSVYKDIKPNDFYIDRQGRPSKMMYESLVYNLVLNKFDPNLPPLPPDTFEEAYTSRNRMVRIYKVLHVSRESKKYCAENRGYQAYLAGTPLLTAYPPKLQSVLAKKQDFAQFEDFNAKAKKKATKKN